MNHYFFVYFTYFFFLSCLDCVVIESINSFNSCGYGIPSWADFFCIFKADAYIAFFIDESKSNPMEIKAARFPANVSPAPVVSATFTLRAGRFIMFLPL